VRIQVKTLTVADIMLIIEEISPTYLAEDWDNVGLQIGALNWPVNKIWVTLDPLFSIVEKACQENVDLLITHHPLFFKPLMYLDIGTVQGRIIAACIRNNLSVYSAHTNFDSVSGGLNDIFADRIGLSHCRVLDDAKIIGKESDGCHGIGRIGALSQTVKLNQLATSIRKRMHLGSIRMVGDPDLLVTKVAVCTGSGGGLLDKFISSEAQVYISGDIKYHDAISVLENGKGVIDVGHFASEQIMLDVVAKRLKKKVQSLSSHAIIVEACHLELDPFTVLT
jgi:dinuclear metal center YbgI/SA1388 family protein